MQFGVKIKACISALLLLVYAFSAGGTVIDALVCHCAHNQTGNACCEAGDHHHEDRTTHFECDCCQVDHTRAAELYISSTASSDSETEVKIPIFPLIDALIPDIPAISGPSATWEKSFERPLLSLHAGCTCSAGLRAPPVFV